MFLCFLKCFCFNFLGGLPSVPHIEVKVAAYAKAVQRVGEENPLIFNLVFVTGVCLKVRVLGHLENAAGEPRVVFIVLPAEEVAHSKVVDDVGGGSGGVLGGEEEVSAYYQPIINGHVSNYISPKIHI